MLKSTCCLLIRAFASKHISKGLIYWPVNLNKAKESLYWAFILVWPWSHVNRELIWVFLHSVRSMVLHLVWVESRKPQDAVDHHKPGSHSAAHSVWPLFERGQGREAGRIKNTNKELMYFAQATGLSLAAGQPHHKLDREGVPVVGSASPG